MIKKDKPKKRCTKYKKRISKQDETENFKKWNEM